VWGTVQIPSGRSQALPHLGQGMYSLPVPSNSSWEELPPGSCVGKARQESQLLNSGLSYWKIQSSMKSATLPNKT
jgi:hypothetical protein